MAEKKIMAVPVNGTWEEIYESLKNGPRSARIHLKVTDDLFDGMSSLRYDGVWRAISKGELGIKAFLMPDGNVSLSECVQQNYGDSDGYGMEPDDYIGGIVAPDGTFINPLTVK